MVFSQHVSAACKAGEIGVSASVPPFVKERVAGKHEHASMQCHGLGMSPNHAPMSTGRQRMRNGTHPWRQERKLPRDWETGVECACENGTGILEYRRAREASAETRVRIAKMTLPIRQTVLILAVGSAEFHGYAYGCISRDGS
jgi:hypothetical protein